MTTSPANIPWHDPAWRVGADNPLQAGLRLQQGWWRQVCREIPDAGRLYLPPKLAGPRNPLVVSMLPETTVGFTPNLMWTAAVDAYEVARSKLISGAGIIEKDRLARNLLSSQPLCFNLFGYLSQVDPNALLPWVRAYAPRATSISRIWLEYAPTAEDLGGDPLGGSAFDAFVEYVLPDESRGFIGIETKYHENLAKGLNIPPEGSRTREKYAKATQLGGAWRVGAAAELVSHRKNLQFWYNQLLAQRTYDRVTDADGTRRYAEFTQVVVACRQDESDKAVVRAVADQLAEGHEGTLRFCAIDDVLDSVTGHDDWKREFRQRYTDFTPIQEHLAPGSPLRTG
jgi:hypothetical protein